MDNNSGNKNRWNNWNGRVAAAQEQPEQKAEAAEPEKLTGKKWWENYWFYYKKHTIIGAIVLVLLAFILHDSLTREKFDVTVVYATSEATIAEQEEVIAEILKQYAADYNGDGKVTVEVDVESLPLNDELGSELFTAMQTRFAGEMAVGEKSIYIMDKTLYDYYDVAGAFEDLEERFPGVEGIDGDKYYINYLFDDEPLLGEFIPECFIMQRGSENMSGYKKKKIQKQYSNETEFFDNLVNGNIVNPRETSSEAQSEQ